ncbi:MAG: hypothetical protein VKP62_13925 [Candidatus Sericytochromatia bacterium]|nr:hypothetical protein [Candidatus Sericytochromatia bacterium]
MSSTMRPFRFSARIWLAGLTSGALLGCLQIATPPAVRPSVPALADPPTTSPSASLGRNAALTLLEPRTDALEVTTTPGRSLTLIASAAAVGNPPLRFVVSPLGELSTYRWTLQGLNRPVPRLESPPEMPYTSRFTVHRDLPAGPVVSRRLAQALPAREPGSTEAFWVNTGDSNADSDRKQVCQLRRVSAHALLYVDQQAKPVSDAQLDQLVTEWESRIYPRLTAVFGQPASPGVDGEPRIFIVLSPAVDNWGKEKGLMGYFWSRDAIPRGGGHSNQKEVLFMTDQLFDRPKLTSYGTLAHEFQHLLNFSRKSARLGYRLVEDTWLDEGLSMYAMELAGYGLPAGDYHIAKDLRGFQENPSAYSLTSWNENPNGFAYGQSYLFVRYLVDRYGSEIVAEILHDNRAGVACLSALLAKRNTTFANHFRAWTIANFLNGTPMAETDEYRYKNLSLKGLYRSSTGLEDIILPGFQAAERPSDEVELALKPWGAAYLAFSHRHEGPWRLKLPAGTVNRLLGATIVP